LERRLAVTTRYPDLEEAQLDAQIFKIALEALTAGMEQEPVAWLLSGGGAKKNVSFDSGNAYADPLREVTPLYTVPPAPVSVPAAMEMDDDFDSAFEHGKAVGWNACRVAMLQSGNFRDNKNSSTNNFREIPETSTSSPGTPAGWISCSDAVPAEYCDVILCDDLGNVFPGSWDKVFCLTRGGNKMAFVDKDGVEVESSTHWMPLPEPPQEVK
ncbi:DUF551 domain-containing protein, partial [Escherichia coli]|uniref:DUF551 domain-containing protein n=1 Tax=Escherichia coli TaxID=562 RepID=UPI002FF3F81D